MKTIFIFLFASLLASLTPAQTDVLTQHNDNFRTGANLTETKLSPTTVSPYTFALLYKLPVDGQVLAQPLVVSRVSVPGHGVVDLAYVVTLHDSVYCFIAGPKGYSQLWKVSLGTSVPSGDVNTGDISPEIGIVSTPVIDRAAGVIYIVAKTKEAGPTYFSRIHALNLLTGAERAGSPVAISGSVAGSANDSSGGQIQFNPLRHMNRPGLLLDHGTLYIAFGSHGDNGPYHGWLFAYDAATLTQKGVMATTPLGDLNYYIPSGAGGIWMAGNGVASDEAGRVYFMVGNGAVSHDGSKNQVGNSIVQVTLGSGGLSTTDFFAPFDSDAMNNIDADLGSAGVMVVPGMNLAMGGGKEPSFFVTSTQQMGGIGTTKDAVVQRLNATNYGLFSSPVCFKGPAGWTVYLGGQGDVVRAYQLTPGGLVPGLPGTVGGPWPGSHLSISASGRVGGILWSISQDAKGMAVLRAFDAGNLRNVLYDSDTVAAQQAGKYAKFAPPTVANGLVFVPTFSGVVGVYGLRPYGVFQPEFHKQVPLGPPPDLEHPEKSKP
jgi:hypothetical protein